MGSPDRDDLTAPARGGSITFTPGRRRNNWEADVPPGPTDDEESFYEKGSRWLDNVTKIVWVCVKHDAGVAEWERDTDSAGSGDPHYDEYVWMPLTTVLAGVPQLVWDDDDNLIPTLTPLI